MPRRARYLVPRGLPHRDEIFAVCVVLAVVAHLLFAQLTIILAAVFYLVTKLTRWRLSWLTIPAVAGLPGLDRDRCQGRGDRLHRRSRPGRRLSGRARPPGRSPAAFHRCLRGHRDLAAPSAAAGPGGRCRRSCRGRRAELAAHRRAGPATGPARPDRGGPAGGHDPRDPLRRGGRQGRRLPGGDGRVGHPDHAVLGRDGRERSGLRFGRARRADDRLPARARRRPAAQAGVRRRSHRRSGAGRPAGGGLCRGGRDVAGVRRRHGGPGRQPGWPVLGWSALGPRGPGPLATSRSGTAHRAGGPR